MDRETRNAIERATQRARQLLEEDFTSQLEGTFDVLLTGAVATRAGKHLTARQAFLRERIVAAVDHKRAAGMKPTEAVADILRDAAFTALNRFVALKMLEARALVQECVTSGEQSAGYKEFCGLAPGVALLPDSAGYRLYIESLFDELSTEVKVLFDRRDPASVLWPRRQTFEELLAVLNDTELDIVWGQDETLGWVYQYFNSGEERRAMRDASLAPRGSRELAVRNQFFTPRYVVEFLIDNTLGRIWYEMQRGETALKDTCKYMIRRPDETYEPRANKDPRDLHVLDPACGSGHFLLYAFDLLVTIYQEGWRDGGAARPPSEATGRTLRDDYADETSLRRAIPQLILRHNLHGVDIDPRCTQIAQLALWMRAQRVLSDSAIHRGERALIRRANIVVAEPMPGDSALVDDFATRLDPPLFRDLFRKIVTEMRLAGELGALIQIDEDIASELRVARERFVEQRTRAYLPGFAPTLQQGELDLSGIDDDLFFHEAEDRIMCALSDFAESATAGGVGARRQLFAGDAAQGIALVELLRKRFDVVVMNPPFGEPPERAQPNIVTRTPAARNDVFVAFVRAGASLLRKGGLVGAITSRAFMVGRDHRHFRRLLLTDPECALRILLDLGSGVLDGAVVETAAYILAAPTSASIQFIDGRGLEKNDGKDLLSKARTVTWPAQRFLQLPQADILYDLDDTGLRSLTHAAATFEPDIGRVTNGLDTNDDLRFVRLRWEVSQSDVGVDRRWTPYAKGGEYGWFTADTHLVVNRAQDGSELAAVAEGGNGNIAATRRSSAYYFRPAVCFSGRSQKGFSARRLRGDACFSHKTQVIVPTDPESPWLLALGPVLASTEYQRLISAQSKFGSYETGPVKLLPVPSDGALEQVARWSSIYAITDELEAADETGQFFVRLPAPHWRPDQRIAEMINQLSEGLSAAGLSLDATVQKNMEALGAQLKERTNVFAGWTSFAIGRALGRFAPSPDIEGVGVPGIAVDDAGSHQDIVARANACIGSCFPDEAARAAMGWTDRGDEIRRWLRSGFFEWHLEKYSRSRRSAPIYWQLATPSASYSVWLYVHALTPDTLYAVHRDYIAPKLAHEERRLEAMRAECGSTPSASERKLMTGQETLVDELRALLAEVKRVTPLWTPQIDDGVVINAAPLWRLFPQYRPWQKELLAAWQCLCDGQYDWSQMAMHLWPERVTPKCANDRSLAIAHGLETVFWVQGASGKWERRERPTTPIAELVRTRTSPAVKEALKNLLGASNPDAGGGVRRVRRARRDA